MAEIPLTKCTNVVRRRDIPGSWQQQQQWFVLYCAVHLLVEVSRRLSRSRGWIGGVGVKHSKPGSVGTNPKGNVGAS